MAQGGRCALALACLLALAARARAQPANDDCADAIVVPSLPFTHTVDISTATTEAGDLSCHDPGGEFGSVPESHSVWYRYTATDDVLLTVAAAGQTFEAVATAALGSCGAITLLNCNVDEDTTTAPVRAGTTVYVAVADADDGGSGGPVDVSITAASIPDGTPLHDGADFQANTVFASYQEFPDVAAAPDGSFVVVWQTGYFPGDDFYEIAGRRFDASGAPIGPDFLVNADTTGDQREPAVDMDASGNFVVVWHGYGVEPGGSAGIQGRRFDFSGAALGGDFQVNAHTTNEQMYPAVARDPAGGFVVVWQSRHQDGSDWGIFGQRYDAAGLPAGGEFQVNTYTTDLQHQVAVSMDASGGFVVTWESYGQGGVGYGVFGRRYDASGTPQGAEFQVSGATAFVGTYPDVSSDPAGGFIVVWQQSDRVMARRFDSGGVPAGGEVVVSDDYYVDSYRTPRVSAMAGGGYVVVWGSDYSFGTGDTGCHGVSGRRLSASGVPMGAQFQVNTYTVGCQRYPAVAMTDTGFVVTHEDYTEFPGRDGYATGIFATRFALTCPAGPRAGCKAPTILHKGQLILRDKTPDKSDSLTWKWLRGDATSTAEIGDPVAGAQYALCLYDASGLIAQALVPAGVACGAQPCWKSLNGLGVKYLDRAGIRDGIQKAVLKSGVDGAAKVIVKGKGDALTMPSLPLSLPVHAQLASSSGTCWEARFESDGVVENSVLEFSARAAVD